MSRGWAWLIVVIYCATFLATLMAIGGLITK